jgi:hypothetical protein
MTNKNDEQLSDFEKKIEEEIEEARVRLSTQIPATPSKKGILTK